jgi:hypothetical protein
MRQSKLSFETVRQISLELPGVQESTAYGMPAFKIDGKLLAAIPANRSVEPHSLVVRMSFEDREELLLAEPKVYYLTEHYRGYDAVLVRLSCVTAEALKDLLRTGRKYVIRTSGVRLSARDRVTRPPKNR